MPPLTISVITPSFNQGRFIERTIRSVIDQGISGLEYVVMDGGSSDETLEVLRCYEDRVRWVSEKDNGQTDAVNKGIRTTKGDIIGWLNSDDVYYPGALKSVLDCFSRRPNLDVVYGNADHIDEEGKVLEPYYTEDWDFERLKELCFLCQPAVFFRRRVTDRLGLLDDQLQYCMDYEYWLRLGAHIPFTRIDQKLAGSRMYGENKTLGNRVAVHKELNDMLKKTLGRVPDKWIFAYTHAVVESKGYDRRRPVENGMFVFQLILVALGAFLHWSRRIPLSGMRTMGQWVPGAFRSIWESLKSGCKG